MSTRSRTRGPAAQPETSSPAAKAPSALWRRLVTAVRGGVNEIGDAIAESQALRILDQEIRDNDAELRRVRETLAETMARCLVAKERLAKANAAIEEYEGYALKALNSGEDALAGEIAAKIALIELERDGEAARYAQYTDGVANLRKVVAQFEANIKRLKQQVDTVRATESVQRAQAAVARRRHASQARVHTALDALERIKRKQAVRGVGLDAVEAAGSEDGFDALDAKLRDAGIIETNAGVDAVLSRLKKKHAD